MRGAPLLVVRSLRSALAAIVETNTDANRDDQRRAAKGYQKSWFHSLYVVSSASCVKASDPTNVSTARMMKIAATRVVSVEKKAPTSKPRLSFSK